MKRSKFSLSNYKLLSMNMGSLVPIGLTEVLPGDSIQQATSALIRCSPLLAPVMHPTRVAIHHWYVPHRLVWDEFEEFITGGPDGMDDTVFPTITLATNPVSTLGDYMGVPITGAPIEVSALPFRAYAKIWNEWYRDQDLQTELVIDETSGPDTTTSTALQNGAWEKDYFTSARPWEQKGPSITLPLGTTAPVKGKGSGFPIGLQDVTGSLDATGSMFFEAGPPIALSVGTLAGTWADGMNVGLGDNVNIPSNVVADLTGVSAITVNALREALALQRFEEARARFGSRYTEYLRYLGVRSSDARLQRPEYLGGGRQTIQFSEVLQTAEGEDPVGEMRGHGIAAMRSNRYRRFIEEHGYIVTVMCVRPKTIYTQGLARTWNRRVKEDFWQKELQHVGQQEVLNKEIYAVGASPNGIFGYQDRYDEYRRTESTVSGEFRTATLDHWHFARQFSSAPALNATFVKSVPTEEPFAVPSQDVLYVMANNSIQARRLVARTGSSFIY